MKTVKTVPFEQARCACFYGFHMVLNRYNILTIYLIIVKSEQKATAG